MIFDEVIGQERARGVLARVLSGGRVPHAFLFHGPEGTGKRLVADLFARSLLCASPGPDAAGCGTCSACRKALHGNHPDLFVISRLPKREGRGDSGPDEDDDTELEGPDAKRAELRPFIVVGQIRALAEHASYAPREGPRRIFLVDPADRMHAESQNALLKTLEEPPGQAVVVLVASRPHVLLPTVRSRCFEVGFGAMSPPALAAALEARGCERDEARIRAVLAEGRPGRALSLDRTALGKRHEETLRAIEALATSRRGLSDLATYADELVGEGESDLVEGLELFCSILRDAARAASGRDALLHADAATRIRAIGNALGAGRCARIVASTDRMRGDLRLNVNRHLLAEALLSELAGGTAPS